MGKASKQSVGKGTEAASKPAAAAKAKSAAPAAATPAKPAKPAPAAKSAAAPAAAGKKSAPAATPAAPAPVTKASAPKPAAPAKPAGKPQPAVAAVPAATKSAKPEATRVETKPDRRDARPSNGTASSAPAAPTSPPAPRVEPVNSSGDSKPKKNQAGLAAKELEFFRDLLLEKRRELIGDMNNMEREALSATEGNLSTLPIHMADMGTDNYEQEFTLGLVEKDRVLLREINHALAKIQNGSYGICEGNGQPITKVRLEAQPWARHSIEYVRSKEKRVGHR